MRRSLAILLLVAAFTVQAKGPKVGKISCGFDNLHLFVTFSLSDGFLSQDVLDAINSTKPTTFTYEVEVAKKRTGWFDKTIGRRVVEKTVTYDNLTRQYDLVTAVDGEEKEKISLISVEEVEESLKGMTALDMGSVVDLSPGERAYYIRVRVTLLKNFVLWIIPSDEDTGWTEKELKTP
ncbi:MAG TPA: DUF4390 domain-containing protein [Acidobacteriota bacterium]|jgi:hypothetical protein|nr:DUF4390 domain-containing protein [Acidobacteriota bacterium]HNT17982.1 DUF4390 domain-containing protein [Acidobacteriota bacterium]HPA26605.1 DUF4390 domain-containing protein [Acidobacteriota bacterium]HQO19455.1 DUF4390 domain-containing protein [Acidobacteriota bacterium]HQQ46013.1 DUF4390 domain-containing protein [Acidobacteriota bacterium]